MLRGLPNPFDSNTPTQPVSETPVNFIDQRNLRL